MIIAIACKTVVFDLDETLVHGVNQDEPADTFVVMWLPNGNSIKV